MKEKNKVEPSLQMIVIVNDEIIVKIIKIILLSLHCVCCVFYVLFNSPIYFKLSVLSSTFTKLNMYFITINNIYSFMCNFFFINKISLIKKLKF